MQFFFLLLFNLFLGAVLYLVISLKLERSATEFRTRRLRKEMDEMIGEFNATAERNISLLERKIRVMRLLLEKAGEVRTLDLIDAENETAAPGEVREHQDAARPAAAPEPAPAPDGPTGGRGAAPMIKKGLLLFVEKIRNKLQEDGTDDGAVLPGAPAEEYPDRGADRRHLIEKDLSAPAPCEDDAMTVTTLTEEEIIEIVTSSPDRYAMVSILSDRGCAIEDISRYSGLPIGEVRLVLNLNSSR